MMEALYTGCDGFNRFLGGWWSAVEPVYNEDYYNSKKDN
jgi:hypothetical protein